MRAHNIDSLFHLPALAENERLSVIYRKMMEKNYDLVRIEGKHLPWDASFFGLEATDLYQKLDEVQRVSLVELLNERLFASFLYVETSGLTIGGKMILAAETFEEKCLYAAFVEDESRHYMEFNRFAHLELEKARHWLPMLDILGSSILEAERETMRYLVHVLLEGFSITHYQVLAQACKDQRLKDSFGRILDDEGRHHTMGYSPKGKEASPFVKDQIFDYARRFLQNMRSSHPVISAYELLFGGLSKQDLEVFQEQSKAKERGAKRALVLENILRKNDFYGLYDKLIAEV